MMAIRNHRSNRQVAATALSSNAAIEIVFGENGVRRATGESQRWSLSRHGCIARLDRKSTRLNSSHLGISYAVFCLKKKKKHQSHRRFSIFISGFCVRKSTTIDT